LRLRNTKNLGDTKKTLARLEDAQILAILPTLKGKLVDDMTRHR